MNQPRVSSARNRASGSGKDKGSCFECGHVNAEQIFNIIETKVVNEYGKFTDQRKITPESWYEFFKSKNKPIAIEEQRTERLLKVCP